MQGNQIKLGKKDSAETIEKKRAVALRHGPETRERMLGNTYGERMIFSEEERQRRREAWLGENNPNWKGGVTEENTRLRHVARYDETVRSVFIRDRGRCRLKRFCNGTNRNLIGHHVVRWNVLCDLYRADAITEDELYSPDYMMTVCFDCHHWIHEGEKSGLPCNYIEATLDELRYVIDRKRREAKLATADITRFAA